MARLSNYTREKMATALVMHRFAERAGDLIAESRALFHVIYDREHSAAMRKHMTAILKERPNAFATDSSFNLNVSGRRMTVGDQNIGKHWRVEVERKPVVQGIDNYPGIGLLADDELGIRALAFADADKKLREDVEVAYREALGALGQFTTGKRLAEDWPEAMPVIGDLIPEDDRTLPVVQVSGLNAKFGLPPSERLAA